MKKLHARKGGFTLIELMIVVAIIGILAAIAIPNFLRFQLKAKTSEGKTNVAAIRTAEQSYFSEYGTYVAAAAAPTTAGSSAKQAFPDPTSAGGFNTIGWAPEGDVYFTYAVGVDASAASPWVAFLASAEADIDADTVYQYWGYHRPAGAGAAVVPAVAAAHPGGASGCLAGLEADAQVGPCDALGARAYGQSIF
jgi:type IV pilus assembly protein PilA